MAPFLQRLDGPAHGFDASGRLDLGREVKVLLGRIHDARVVIQSGTVARRHLELQRGAAGWEAVDLLSTNGSFLNGARIRRAALQHRDVLEFPGGPVLQFLERDEPVAQSPSFEAEIAKAPGARAPYRVYADWLQEQGDPLGTFINTPAVNGVEQMRWAGTLATAVGLRVIELEWHCGFFAGATITGAVRFPLSLAQTLQRLVDHRLARFLTALRLELRPDGARGAEQAVEVLSLLEQTALPSTLSSVRLFSAMPFDTERQQIERLWQRVRAKHPFLDEHCF